MKQQSSIKQTHNNLIQTIPSNQLSLKTIPPKIPPPKHNNPFTQNQKLEKVKPKPKKHIMIDNFPKYYILRIE
jgi:hypothetical protein